MRDLTELNRDRNDDGEVWVKHYSSKHQTLLLGEGDFSFSCSLATCFGSASNIYASPLDSYDTVVRKYKKARSNIETLKRLGAFVLHGVDATKLQLHPDLLFRRFDRVIFNFPHTGFHSNESDPCQIQRHRELVFGFFHGASHMLRADGEIHVTHKNNAPYCNWNLEELASRCFLVLIQCVAFEKSNYPGYENKRGDGSRCDQPFPMGKCSTFKFKFSLVAKELYAEKVQWRAVKERESKCPQEQVLECTNRFNKVSFEMHNGVLKRMVTRTSVPHHHTKESPAKCRLHCQDFAVQASPEAFPERSLRFNGISHRIYKGKVRKSLIRSSFTHPYTKESRERSMTRFLAEQRQNQVTHLHAPRSF